MYAWCVYFSSTLKLSSSSNFNKELSGRHEILPMNRKSFFYVSLSWVTFLKNIIIIIMTDKTTRDGFLDSSSLLFQKLFRLCVYVLNWQIVLCKCKCNLQKKETLKKSFGTNGLYNQIAPPSSSSHPPNSNMW